MHAIHHLCVALSINNKPYHTGPSSTVAFGYLSIYDDGVQKQLSRHVVMIILFKMIMLIVLGYLFYGFIGRPYINSETAANNLLSASPTMNRN